MTHDEGIPTEILTMAGDQLSNTFNLKYSRWTEKIKKV